MTMTYTEQTPTHVCMGLHALDKYDKLY